MFFIFKIIHWIPAIIWMVLIYYFSGRTSNELQGAFPFIKDFNPGHIAAYFIFALLVFYPLNKSKTKHPFFFTLILSVLYGISDEIHQAFVPTRQPDVTDLMRDFLGATLALLAVRAGQKIKSVKMKENLDMKEDLDEPSV